MPPEPNIDHPLESAIEALALQNEELKEQGSEANSLLEAIALQTKENNVDTLLEAQIENDNHNTEKLETAIKESKMNIEIEGAEIATLKGDKGEKGDKGDKGEDGRVEIVLEDGQMIEKEGKVTIKGLKGDKGDTGDVGPEGKIGPMGPQGLMGERGPMGLPGGNGKDGIDGKDGKGGSPDTPKQIKNKLESLEGDERLDMKAIKGVKDFQKQIDKLSVIGSNAQMYSVGGTKVSENGHNLNLIAGSNVTITGSPTSNGADITISSTGGGGTPGGSNKTIQFNHNGAFSGDTGFTYDVSTGTVFLDGTFFNYLGSGGISFTGNTLTDNREFDFPNQDGTIALQNTVPYIIPIVCSDETTNLTTGTAKVTFRMPKAMTLTAVRASVNTAPTGSTLIVDINEGGSTILSTKLSIDIGEKTSTTASTPAVISDTALADDAEITIDIDQIGSTIAGKGLKVYLIGTYT